MGGMKRKAASAFFESCLLTFCEGNSHWKRWGWQCKWGDEAGIASAFGARQQEEAFGEEAGRRNGDGGETSPSPHHQRMLCSNCQTIHAEDVPFQLSDIQMSVHPISFAKPLASCQPHQKCHNKKMLLCTPSYRMKRKLEDNLETPVTSNIPDLLRNVNVGSFATFNWCLRWLRGLRFVCFITHCEFLLCAPLA